MCRHNEGTTTSGLHRIDRHDCDYVDRRTALIDRAAALADKMAGKMPAGDATTDEESAAHALWAASWNRAFHDGMARLSAEAEKKHDAIGKLAQADLVNVVRRWRLRGLTLTEAGTVLRKVREAV